MKINGRRAAVKILMATEKEGEFSNVLLNQMFTTHKVEPVDKRFITRLVYGVLENRINIDYKIKKIATARLKKIEPQVLMILRISIFQIDFLDRVPSSAVVNEAVKLAKKVNPRYGGFVNGILRQYLREKDNFKMPSRDKDLLTYLSVTYSHAPWMIQKWLDKFGESQTEAILKANNSQPEMSLRVNSKKVSQADLIKALTSEGVSVRPSDIVPSGVIIEQLGDVQLDGLTAYKQGWFQVQDESSMIVGEIAPIKDEDKVMDVCAAPGGKTTHMAQKLSNQGLVVARDLREDKLKYIQENALRLGLENIEVAQGDARVFEKAHAEVYDLVLVDAPCSNLGIIRRKPEVKYNKTQESIDSLSKIQSEILENSSRYVKNGGCLIYSTCTIDSEENEFVVEKFLKAHPDYKLMKIEGFEALNWFEDQPYLQTLPKEGQTDGFFICKMIKEK